MQNHVVNILVTDLRPLIRDLTKDGGLMGPSIYDTAQAIRLAPPASGVWPALNWLIQQQQPDGGWGDPAVPLARDVPTLAVLLALHTHASRAHDREVLRKGLAFLRRHMMHWASLLPDALPVGVELLLPRLLEEAEAAGLSVPWEPYAELLALGRRRMEMLADMPMFPGMTPVHAWEAWGVSVDASLLDPYGSMGHSPAATAAWLRATTGRADLAEARAAAYRYLEDASKATMLGIPGVVPTAWPITRFEQSNALYALLIGGLLHHPDLQDVLRPQIEDLAQALRPEGLGFSDFFVPDGDDTAEALAVLLATGHPIDLSILNRFSRANHFCAYPGELQPALSVTAHAVHVLRLCGQDASMAQQHLVESQLSDGRWCGDKWNGSWLYTTCQVLVALEGTQYKSAMARAAQALLAHQHPDGGWGAHGSNMEETAYGVMAFRTLVRDGTEDSTVHQALERAERWMLRHYRPFNLSMHPCWQAKEIYRPHRLARMIELAATFPSSELATPLHISQSVGGVTIPRYSEQSITVNGKALT